MEGNKQPSQPSPPPPQHPAGIPVQIIRSIQAELPAPLELEFSPAPTSNIQPDSPLHALSNELLAIIFEYVTSHDHFSLRQTSITFYHIIHSMYSAKRRLVIKCSTRPSQEKLLNQCISVCMRQSSALDTDLPPSDVRVCTFELTYRNIKCHLILFRHALAVTQLVLAQIRENKSHLYFHGIQATAYLIGGLTSTGISLDLIKLINYSGDASPLVVGTIDALAQHTASIRHFSFYSRCPNGLVLHTLNDSQSEFFQRLEEFYIGSYRPIENLASKVAAARRLGFYQKCLSSIVQQIEGMPNVAAQRVTHLTIRDLEGKPFELTEAVTGQIRAKVPNAELL